MRTPKVTETRRAGWTRVYVRVPVTEQLHAQVQVVGHRDERGHVVTANGMRWRLP